MEAKGPSLLPYAYLRSRISVAQSVSKSLEPRHQGRLWIQISELQSLGLRSSMARDDRSPTSRRTKDRPFSASLFWPGPWDWLMFSFIGKENLPSFNLSVQMPDSTDGMIHLCNPRHERLRQEDQEFKVSLGHIISTPSANLLWTHPL